MRWIEEEREGRLKRRGLAGEGGRIEREGMGEVGTVLGEQGLNCV